MPALLIAAGALGAVLCVAAIHSRSGIFAPFPFFLASALLYSVPSLLTIWLNARLGDDRGVGIAVVLTGIRITFVALAAATLAYVVTRERARRPVLRPAWRAIDPKLDTIVVTAMGMAGAAGLGAFVLVSGGVAAMLGQSYGDFNLNQQGWGPLIAGIHPLVVAAVVQWGIALRRPTWFTRGAAIGLTTLLAVWMATTGARGPFFHILIGIVLMRTLMGRRFHPLTLMVGVLALLAIGIMVEVTRARVPLSVLVDNRAEVLTRINPANQEFGAAVATVGDVARYMDHALEYRWGRTYFQAPAIVVPQALWPSRPPGGGAAWYVQTLYPEYAAIGGGWAFSPIAEALLNFGIVGVVGAFAIIGWALARVQLLIDQSNAPFWIVVMYGVAGQWLFMFSRLDSAMLVKHALVFHGVPLLAIWVLGRMLHLAIVQSQGGVTPWSAALRRSAATP